MNKQIKSVSCQEQVREENNAGKKDVEDRQGDKEIGALHSERFL